jgi:hypothetical protein
MSENIGAEHDRIERSLTNQPPIHTDVVQVFETLRLPYKDAAHLTIDLIPPSRERSLALTKLEEALMWAVKAVAVDQPATLQRITDQQLTREAEA